MRSAPHAVIERFAHNIHLDHRHAYNEARVHRESVVTLLQSAGRKKRDLAIDSIHQERLGKPIGFLDLLRIRAPQGSSAPKAPMANITLQRQIDAIDRQTDQLVYALYDLTHEEGAPGMAYAIVEEANN